MSNYSITLTKEQAEEIIHAAEHVTDTAMGFANPYHDDLPEWSGVYSAGDTIVEIMEQVMEGEEADE